MYDVDAIQPAAHRVSLFEGAEGGRWFSGKCQVTTSWPLDGSGCWSVLRSHMTCCHKSKESKPFFQALSGGKRRLMLGTLNALETSGCPGWRKYRARGLVVLNV